jgi:spore germination cell wall hydrolase CwlJ-like protein
MLSSLLFTVLTALGSQGKPLVQPTTPLECLAQNIYFEARSESIAGQKAVAYVTLNRVSDPAYPKSICGVVTQGIKTRNGSPVKGMCQFSWYCDGKRHTISERNAWYTAVAVATMTIMSYNREDDPTHGALFYHKVEPQKKHLKSAGVIQLANIGQHSFYNRKGA